MHKASLAYVYIMKLLQVCVYAVQYMNKCVQFSFPFGFLFSLRQDSSILLDMFEKLPP